MREFVNYRHPGPRRVWKGGSEQQLVTPFPVDPLDPLDPVDPLQSSACPKVGARLHQTLLLQQISRLVGTQALGEPWEALGELWESFGRVWGTVFSPIGSI